MAATETKSNGTDAHDEILGSIIDDVRVAAGFGQGHLLRGSRRADRRRPECFEPLPQQ